jgi:hypothetical protein
VPPSAGTVPAGSPVYGYDETAHRVVEERVSATFVHEGIPVGTLALADGAGCAL